MYHILLEIAYDLLNDAIAAYTMIHIKDPSRKSEMDIKKQEARNILMKSENFMTTEQVQKIIDEYAPIVRSLYNTKKFQDELFNEKSSAIRT